LNLILGGLNLNLVFECEFEFEGVWI
jgi:hypothetical protein